ncbi:MAG TPA: hypothetical protein VE110_10480, partial [Gemmatimonadaceae bacterium]|nr:hypothetical protein [Gemmatimonadaceae bacterium]
MKKLLLIAIIALLSISRPVLAQSAIARPFGDAVGFAQPNMQTPDDSTRPRVFGSPVNDDQRRYFLAGSAAGALSGAIVAGAVLLKGSHRNALPIV